MAPIVTSSAAPSASSPAPLPPVRGRGSFRRGLEALRVRNFRRYWIGQVISIVGTWMQTTAQGWIVLLLSKSPFELGLVTALQFLPILLFSFVGGAIIDALPKYRLILFTQIGLMLTATIFGALAVTGHLSMPIIYVIVLAQGLMSAIDGPTRNTFSVSLVGREKLANVVALNSVSFNIGRVVGPSLAGFLIPLIGAAPVLLLNAASYIGVLAGLLMIDHSAIVQPERKAEGSLRERLVEGLRFAWRTPLVSTVLMIIAAIGTFGFNFTIIMPLLSGYVLRTDASGLGLLWTSFGFGSLCAALGAAMAEHISLRRLTIAAFCFSLLLAVLGLSNIMPLSMALLALLGFAGIVFGTSASTLLQTNTPPELQGRVLSLQMMLFAGTTPIGGLILGTCAQWFSAGIALLVCSGLCMLGVGAALLRYRTISRFAQPGEPARQQAS